MEGRINFRMIKNALLEIACFNFESAVIAEQNRADRIELCENYNEGGITPRHDLIRKVKEVLQIPVNVIIRPRGGNFIYSDQEFESMKQDIQVCHQLKIDGVVFGMLQPDGAIDLDRCRELVRISKPMSLTFHRAFDETPDPFLSMESLVESGFDRILTSGHQSTALKGIDLIQQLVEKSNGRIVLMPGGGVRSENISELLKSGALEFHSAALINNRQTADGDEIQKMKSMLTGNSIIAE
jgi:copper homeostasis protein